MFICRALINSINFVNYNLNNAYSTYKITISCFVRLLQEILTLILYQHFCHRYIQTWYMIWYHMCLQWHLELKVNNSITQPGNRIKYLLKKNTGLWKRSDSLDMMEISYRHQTIWEHHAPWNLFQLLFAIHPLLSLILINFNVLEQ
jgi:hypothetical protein